MLPLPCSLGVRASEMEKELVQGKVKELLRKVTQPEEFAGGLQALLRLASGEEGR